MEVEPKDPVPVVQNKPATNTDIKETTPTIKKTKSILKTGPTQSNNEKQILEDKFSDVQPIDSSRIKHGHSPPVSKKSLSFSREIDSIKKMLLEPKTRLDNIKLSPYFDDKLRKIKSPSPIRDITTGAINDNNSANGKNRNRFAKKKLSTRSQSVELSRLDAVLAETTPDFVEVDRREKIKHIRQAIPPPNSRPNLKRQNAFTKSLGDNLDKAYQEDIDRRHKQGKHNRRHHNNNRHFGRYKRSHYRSTSLTSSSQSESQSNSSECSTSSSSSTSSSIHSHHDRRSSSLRFKIDNDDDNRYASKNKSLLILLFGFSNFCYFNFYRSVFFLV